MKTERITGKPCDQCGLATRVKIEFEYPEGIEAAREAVLGPESPKLNFGSAAGSEKLVTRIFKAQEISKEKSVPLD